jgi:glycosyltransferase involved in cell wall biosynthesis
MKALLLIACFLYPFVYGFSSKNSIDNKWPLIAVVIMVKNEESVIQPTLLPYIQAGIDAFLVYDTGSTDKTIEKAKELFDQHHLEHGYIKQDSFIDFSTSRNRALDAAQDLFPNAVFLIMPDAEWYIKNIDNLMDFCRNESKNIQFSAYFVRIKNSLIDFYVPRLLTASCRPRFIGVVHEAIPVTQQQADCARLSGDIYFDLQPSHFGAEKSKKRWERDKDLLLKEFKKDPTNSQTTFYLAQTYESLCEYEKSYYYYSIRVKQKTLSAEDDFMAAYKFALMTDFLSAENKKEWGEALELYLNAYQMRPNRAEPLIRIAQHYLKEQKMWLAFFFAKKATELSYPTDRIFVEREMYTFVRYEILSASAFYVGENVIGEWATQQALKIHPEYEYLQNNLKVYQGQNKK